MEKKRIWGNDLQSKIYKKKKPVPAPELLSLSKMEVNRSVNEIRRVYLRLIRMKAIRLDSVPNTKPRDIISNLMKQMERNLVFFSSISNDAERQKWERGGRPVDPTKKKRKEKKKKRKKREREREREREKSETSARKTAACQASTWKKSDPLTLVDSARPHF